MNPQAVLKFWFEDIKPAQWFKKDPRFDETVKIKFAETHKSASRGELYQWRATTLGRLAEIIVLDQFSRNIFREKPEAFEQDRLALILAQELVLLDLDRQLTVAQKPFAYMPYMHSESKLIHVEALRLFSKGGMDENLNFEIAHKKVIDQFGRYPHRNEILGRISTPKELEFLKTHSGF